MWCLYQNQDKTQRHNKPFKLPSCCSYQLCLQDHGTHDQQQTRVVPGKKQNYHTCTVWFLQRLKYHRPACTFGIFCQRGIYSEAALYCYFHWSRKGLQVIVWCCWCSISVIVGLCSVIQARWVGGDCSISSRSSVVLLWRGTSSRSACSVLSVSTGTEFAINLGWDSDLFGT